MITLKEQAEIDQKLFDAAEEKKKGSIVMTGIPDYVIRGGKHALQTAYSKYSWHDE